MRNGELMAQHFSYIRIGVHLRAKALPWQMDRDDIVGCVLVRIAGEVPRYDPRVGTFKTWLEGRMGGAVTDAKRMLAPGTRAYPVIVRQLRRPDRCVDPRKESDGAARLIGDTLAEIPERWRDALLMRFRDGHDVSEIAKALGVSDGRVSQILKAALTRMRAILAARRVLKVGDVI